MVFFRVSENINIKTTDGTIVKYLKLRNPAQLIHNSVYVTTYDELERLDKVFNRVGDEYKTQVILEKRFRTLKSFPKELGVSNAFEYRNIKSYEAQYLKEYNPHEKKHPRFYLNEEWVDIHNQLHDFDKTEISLAIIGNVGEHIGQMVASLTALHMLHRFLSHTYEKVRLDLYIEASENKFYSRDKMILSTQKYISNVYPLSLSLQKLCEYDFYIDNSSVKYSRYYEELPYVDAYLYKFGLDYKKIADKSKYNDLSITDFKIKNDLQKKIEDLKQRGEKLLLFHPFSAEPSRSMPKEVAQKLLKQLIQKVDDYVIVTVLSLTDIKDEHYVNLTSYSKTVQDFIYIISNMNKIITVDTSTYHIADAFFIPTVVFFNEEISQKRIAYYQQTKAINIGDESKNFSRFKFDNEPLVLYKFDSWKKIKISKVMKVLETI